MPKVSVIMGIYNCAITLPESIESILMQTYSDWELIMCDDGSTDNTYTIALKYSQAYDNISLVQNKKNMGLNYTLNKCLKIASGEYIARMDGDDISYLQRFEKEVTYLDNNPNISFVSAAMEYFDENGVWGRGYPIETPEPKDFVQGTPFAHAPCMVRKDAYMAVNGYTIDKKLLRVEDYHLWIKMYSKGYKGINLKEILYKMRDDRNAMKRRKFKYRWNEVRVKCIAISSLGLHRRWYISALKPIIIGILPIPIYKMLHKKKLREK